MSCKDAYTAAVEHFISYILRVLSDADNDFLLKPVDIEEVRAAVWKLDPNSASGSDGFSGRFDRSCWDVIASDLHPAVLEFF